MERFALSEKIILLFDSYSEESRYLHESFLQTGLDCMAVSLEENDFLPRNVVSIYDLLSGDFQVKRNGGKPRFFNEVEVPDEWSIQAGDRESGSITYLHEEKGMIHYLKSEKKFLVEIVEWYDRKGRVRFKDHYNRFGNVCARTVCDINGQPCCKTRLSASGKEVVTENYVTSDFIFHSRDVTKIFHSKLDMILYWLTKNGIEQSRIFYNSLSTPFLISNRLGTSLQEDVLFWQEPIGWEIPGNMRLILNGVSGRTKKIVVQKRRSYERLLELGVDKEIVQKLGYIYLFKKENKHKSDALVCTNSERIEHCEELIKTFPQMHFHIAAITTMSPRLMELDAYENVSLYPGVEKNVQDELFRTCDYYFDINHRDEIISAIYQAFLHNLLIFAFEETVHNREYVADEQIYPVAEFDRMLADVKTIMEDETVMQRRLEKQREYAMAEKKETYIQALDL